MSIFPTIGDMARKSLKYLKKVGDIVEPREPEGDALIFFDNARRTISKNIDRAADIEGVFINVPTLAENIDALPILDYLTGLMDNTQL